MKADQLIEAYAARVRALERIGAHYRTGTTPSESLLRDMENTRARLAVLLTRREAEQARSIEVHVSGAPRITCPACGHGMRPGGL